MSLLLHICRRSAIARIMKRHTRREIPASLCTFDQRNALLDTGMMRLFVDTNSLLGYFAEDSDTKSLEELERLLKGKGFRFFYTEQSENEYARNIGNRIDQTREAIKKSALQLKYTPTIEDDALEKTIKTKVDEANKAFDAHQQKRRANYETKAQKTHELIERIFKLGERADYADAIIERARLRHVKGNPPKKENSSSHGDAINWESILEHASDDDLVLITHDQDYTEKSAKGLVLNRVLEREWNQKTKKALSHHTALGKFINSFEKKGVIPKSTIKREDLLTRQFEYNASAVASALSAIRLADTATMQAASSLASSIPNLVVNSGVLTVTDALRTHVANMEALSGSLRISSISPDLLITGSPIGDIITAQNGFLTLTKDAREAARSEPKKRTSEDSEEKH